MMALTDKTPWDPSPQHVARIRSKMPAPRACPYCDSPVRIVNNSEIYGASYGEWPWSYACTHCDAYVGMHPFTATPLGTLANKALRSARNKAKAPFDLLWKPSTKKRSAAYQALAAHLTIDIELCNFGLFDEAACDKAWRWALEQAATPESAHDRGSAAARHGIPISECPFLNAELTSAWRKGWRALPLWSPDKPD